MKVCPRCQKTYSDDNLNFCLDDGAMLEQRAASNDSIPATVLMNQPRPTAPNQLFENQPQQGNWGSQNQQFTMQPQAAKKSKTWLWVVGILGGVMLLCGGGFAGLVYLGIKSEAQKQNYNSGFNSARNSNSVFASNTKIANSKNSNSLTVQTSDEEIDLSEWAKGDTEYGVTEYRGDEFFMSSKRKNYYYVLASKDDYKTENAATSVSVRNVNEDNTRLGFGLVVHSNPIAPLLSDYAFLIDSENKKYRIVSHSPAAEKVVVGWTRFAAIKGGTEKNVLEVRDAGGTMTFYINGESVKSVANSEKLTGGVAGLYSGDAAQIAFSDFKISK